jgi:8-oxo-dGTP diphosphatase
LKKIKCEARMKKGLSYAQQKLLAGTGEGRLLEDDLSNYDPSGYKDPSVTVDICICTIFNNDLKILLIKRKHPPYRNRWAIPGGFLEVPKRETLEETAARELREETCLKDIYIEQLKTYGNPDRDPRKRVITVAYFALVPYNSLKTQKIEGKDDAKEAKWFSLRKLPPLAFDHKVITKDLLDRIVGKIGYSPIAFSLVPKEFTWNDLQAVYEAVLGFKLVTSNFRRKIKSLYTLDTLSLKEKGHPGRPSVYLTFSRKKEDFNT